MSTESKGASVEVRGMPKCGRFWKTPKTKYESFFFKPKLIFNLDSLFYFRFSSINKTKGLKLSFERKQKLREDIKKTRELSRTLINEKNAENEARKERRRENIKRRSENQKKSEIVQVVMHFFLKQFGRLLALK